MTHAHHDSHLDRSRFLGRRRLLQLGGLMGIGAFSLAATPAAMAAVRKAKPGRHIVVLDAGHGGIDPGCIGISGTYEKHIAFNTVREVARQLEATGRYTPVLTRSSDTFLPLAERVERARHAGAALFLSVHADSLPSPSMRGASVFTLSDEASDVLAARIAAQENKADLIGGVLPAKAPRAVKNILVDLMRRETKALSVRFGEQLVSHLGKRIVMLPNSQRAAGFAVLKAPEIPSALVEIGCLSNREEERVLRNAGYRQKVAGGIAQSVDTYFREVVGATTVMG